MKILVVDDSPIMRREIINILDNPEDEFLQCEDGAFVSTIYSNHKPDIVFMDIAMKQLNGIAATKKLIAEYPDAKVVIVTNYSDQKLKEKAILAGAMGYVLKEDLKALLTIQRRQ